MSNYSQITDFSAKDSLSTGDPEKAILGSDVDAELAAISTAIASKLDSSGYTAADVLTKIKTVDGAGSGLDADSVDGVGPFAAGTYTPTVSSTSNIDSTSIGRAIYMRMGSIVHVAIAMNVDATTGAAQASFKITLPIASAIANDHDVIGVAYTASGDAVGTIEGSAADDLAIVEAVPTGTSSAEWTLIFTYIIL